VSEERSRQSRGTPLGRERAHALDKVQARVSGRPAPSKRPAERLAIYCEIDSLPAELERAELSSAGAFVLSTQPPQVDSEVSIFLRLGEQRFEMTGHVVNSVSCEQAAKQGKKPGYAVLFTNMPEGERKRISGALQNTRASLRPRASPPPKAATPSKASPPLTASQPSKTPAAASTQHSRSPARPAAPAFEPSELALLEKLEQELAQVEEKTAWAVLGVSQGAEPERIKTAFFQASKRYHPHLFARYAHPEIKRVVTELFIAHKRAFTTMTKLNKKP
jgi:PilZ domain